MTSLTGLMYGYKIMFCAAVTLKENLFNYLIEDQRGTFEALDTFSKDWKGGKPSKLLT